METACLKLVSVILFRLTWKVVCDWSLLPRVGATKEVITCLAEVVEQQVDSSCIMPINKRNSVFSYCLFSSALLLIECLCILLKSLRTKLGCFCLPVLGLLMAMLEQSTRNLCTFQVATITKLARTEKTCCATTTAQMSGRRRDQWSLPGGGTACAPYRTISILLVAAMTT